MALWVERGATVMKEQQKYEKRKMRRRNRQKVVGSYLVKEDRQSIHDLTFRVVGLSRDEGLEVRSSGGGNRKDV